ncbi:unnamed protein product [Victoria cruziana]
MKISLKRGGRRVEPHSSHEKFFEKSIGVLVAWERSWTHLEEFPTPICRGSLSGGLRMVMQFREVLVPLLSQMVKKTVYIRILFSSFIVRVV